jgi:hypothetical protein
VILIQWRQVLAARERGLVRISFPPVGVKSQGEKFWPGSKAGIIGIVDEMAGYDRNANKTKES